MIKIIFVAGRPPKKKGDLVSYSLATLGGWTPPKRKRKKG